MSTPTDSSPAKLIIGILLKEPGLLAGVQTALVEQFGEVECASDWLPFDYTNYYQKEMGASLVRKMLVFETLIDPSRLPDIKWATHRIEKQLSRHGRRRVNIDPGYLVAERFVLATGKNFSHRIYLDKGIYADLTLIFQKGRFRSLPWTYPDYADRPLRQFIENIRKSYLERRKQEVPG